MDAGEDSNLTAAEEEREDLIDDLHYAARCGELQEVKEALAALEKFHQLSTPRTCCCCSSCSSRFAHVRLSSGQIRCSNSNNSNGRSGGSASGGATDSSSSSNAGRSDGGNCSGSRDSSTSACDDSKKSSAATNNSGGQYQSVCNGAHSSGPATSQRQPLGCTCCCCSPVNARESRGGLTALHMAAANGHTAVAEYLISSGAQHLANNSGNTPLHWAVTNKHVAMVKLLLGSSSAAPSPPPAAAVSAPATVSTPHAVAPASAAVAASCGAPVVSAAPEAGTPRAAPSSAGRRRSAAAAGVENEEEDGGLRLEQLEGDPFSGAFVIDVLQRNSVGRSALSEGFDSGDAEILQLLLEHPSAQQLEEAYAPMFQAKRRKPMSRDAAVGQDNGSSCCSRSSGSSSSKKRSGTSSKKTNSSSIGNSSTSSRTVVESGSTSAGSPSSSDGCWDASPVSSADKDKAGCAAAAASASFLAAPPASSRDGARSASERRSKGSHSSGERSSRSSSREHSSGGSGSGGPSSSTREENLCSCAAESHVVQSVVHELRLGCSETSSVVDASQQQQEHEEKRACGEGLSPLCVCGDDFDAAAESRRQSSHSSSEHSGSRSSHLCPVSGNNCSSSDTGGNCSSRSGRKSVFVREVGLSWIGDPFEGEAAAGDTTGVHLWTAAVVGAQWMTRLARRGEFANKSVLEVGAGCGLVGMTAALFSEAPLKKLFLTDVFPHALENLKVGLRLNNLLTSKTVCSSNASTNNSSSSARSIGSSSTSVKSSADGSRIDRCTNRDDSGRDNNNRNNTSIQIHGDCEAPGNCNNRCDSSSSSGAPLEAVVTAFDWDAHPSSWPEGWHGGWDVVVGSDLVYEHRTVQPLAAAVAQLLRKPSGVFYYVHRLERQGAGSFVDALRRNGLSCDVEKAPDEFFVNPFAYKREDDAELCLPELRHRDFELVRCCWHQ